MIRLNDLKIFMSVCSFGSMGEAARMLGITQPSVSESVKRLESDLGGAVFYRSRKGIKLSPFGLLVKAKAEIILSNIENISTLNNIGTRCIKIGCHAAVASYTLPATLSKYLKQFPQTQLKLVNNHSRTIQEMVQDGQLDVGIVINPLKNPDLIIKLIGTDIIRVWKNKGTVNKSCVIFDPDLVQTQSLLRRWKNSPQSYIHCTDFRLIIEFTQKGLGFGIIPERVVKQSGKGLEIYKKDFLFTDEIAIVYRPEFGKNKLEKELINTIKSVIIN